MNNKVSKNYVRCILFLNKNSGFPKYRKIYGNGAVVLGLQTEGYQQFYSSKQSAVDNGTKSLEQSLEFSKLNKCLNAFNILTDSLSLRACYWKIKSKTGNMNPVIEETTLEGLNDQYFFELQNDLRLERWKPSPTKKVYIKKNNGKYRPLRIYSFKDKIVQESFRMVLEAVLESKFLNVSTGFRKNKR